LASIFGGLLWFGNIVDFFSILITGFNIDNTYGFVGISSAIWVPPAYILFAYIALRILLNTKWKLILISLIILGIIYEILLFLDPSGSISYHYPAEAGVDLIEDNFVFESPSGIILSITQVIVIIFNVIGVSIRGLQSKGIIRKKMLFISLGAFIIIICGFLDSIILPGIFLILNRIMWLLSFLIIYKGIKEEIEKPKELKSKTELKVEGDLFRLIKTRSSEITEEEITYLKESKKCLVCKGDATGFNIYVCPNCDVLYCQRCARILVDKENACWSCSGPIDKSKPISLEKEEQDKVEPKFIKNKDSL